MPVQFLSDHCSPSPSFTLLHVWFWEYGNMIASQPPFVRNSTGSRCITGSGSRRAPWCTNAYMDSHLRTWLTWSGRSRSKEPGRRHLRSAARGDLVVPAFRTRTFGPRAFAISGPDSWNNIPVALRDTALSFHEFCVKLKTELYRQINWNWTISAFVTVSTVRSFSAR